MSYLQDILNSRAYQERCGYSYRVLKNKRVVFNTSLTGRVVTAKVKLYDPTITVDTLPEKYFLAALYFVMHRFYSQSDANKSQYYYQLHEQEMRKVSHNRLGSPYVSLGGDL